MPCVNSYFCGIGLLTESFDLFQLFEPQPVVFSSSAKEFLI